MLYFASLNFDGETTGAFLRGTRGEDNTFMGYAKGIKRTEGWFYFKNVPSVDSVETVVLCKSPIDALSLAVLQIQDSGNTPEPRIMYLVADCPKSFSSGIPEKYPQSGNCL